MRPAGRGHRVVDHTADEILEAWGDTRAACLEEVATGFVRLFADPSSAPRTRSHEVTLDAADDRTLVLGLLDEIIYLLDAESAAPVSAHVDDHGGVVRVRFQVADVADLAPTGPAPKGVSHSGLDLHGDDDRWTARMLIDV